MKTGALFSDYTSINRPGPSSSIWVKDQCSDLAKVDHSSIGAEAKMKCGAVREDTACAPMEVECRSPGSLGPAAGPSLFINPSARSILLVEKVVLIQSIPRLPSR